MESDPTTSSRCRRKTFTVQQSPTARQTPSSADLCNRTFISQPEVPVPLESANAFNRTIVVDSGAGALAGTQTVAIAKENVGQGPVGSSKQQAKRNGSTVPSSVSIGNMDKYRAFEDSGDISFLINERLQQHTCKGFGLPIEQEEILNSIVEKAQEAVGVLDRFTIINRLSCGATPGKNANLDVSAKSDELFETTAVQSEGSPVPVTPATPKKLSAEMDLIRIEKGILKDELDKATNRLQVLPASIDAEIQSWHKEAREKEARCKKLRKKEEAYGKDTKDLKTQVKETNQHRKDMICDLELIAPIPIGLLKVSDEFVCRDKTICDNFRKASVKPCEIKSDEPPPSTT